MLRPAFALSLLLSSVAAAQITAVGTLPGSDAWAGTVTMTGDVTVPVGATLTIQPGTVVTAAATDSVGGGDATTRVELIVQGTLIVAGVNNGGVTFTGAGTGTSAWGGIVVRAGGSVSLSYATLDEMQNGVRAYVGASGVTTTLTLSNSTISGSAAGLMTLTNGTGAGTGTIDVTNSTFNTSAPLTHAVGALTLTDSLVTGASGANALYLTGGTINALRTRFTNNSNGLYVGGGTSATFDGCTIAFTANGNALETSVASNHTTTVTSSIISHNAGFGVRRSGSGTFNVTNTNIWGNSNSAGAPPTTAANTANANVSNVGASIAYGNAQNNKSENPLYVDTAARNYRLTHRSPSRKSGSSGIDQGALAYTTDQTSTLQGTIWESLSLSGANSVVGDLTVASGVTLTINPGATLTFAVNDASGAGENAAKAELSVIGTLSAIGVSGSLITFTGAGTTPTAWGGVVLRPGGTATVANANLDKMDFGFRPYVGASGVSTSLTGSNLSISNSTGAMQSLTFGTGAGTGAFNFTNVTFGATGGVEHSVGALSLTDSIVTGSASANALYVLGGTVNALRTRFTNNSNGLYVGGGTSATFDRCTIAFIANGNALETSVASNHTTTVTSSIISHNAGFGVRRSGSGTFNVTNTNIWGNSNSAGAPPTTAANTANANVSNVGASIAFGNAQNNISENPLYVDAAARNYRLTSNSPSRKVGASGEDQGALAYTTDATVGLQGWLWANTTLSGANQVLGDLTVAPGVTLTINPGATLTFANNDSMGGANVANKGELVVLGTLSAVGVSGSGITFTAAAASGWRSLVLRPGSSATVANATFTNAQTPVHAYVGQTGVTTTLSLNNSTVSGSSSCLRTETFGTGAGTGTFNVSSSTFTNCAGGTLEHVVGALNVQASSFVGNTGGNVLYMVGGTFSAERTLFANNSNGIYIGGGSSATFDRCTIAFTASGNALETSVASNHTTTVISSIISHNAGFGVRRSGSGTFNVTYSNLWGNSNSYGPPPTGSANTATANVSNVGASLTGGSPQFNKSENPLYADTATRNYALQSTSPSRSAGANGVDQGAFPFSVGAVATLQISPSIATVAAGGVVGFSVQARDAMGNIVPNATYTWAVAPAAGTITSSGVLTASCTPGTYTAAVTATASNGVSANATVTINIGAASQVTVTPATPSVKSQATEQFTAQVRDACNNVITGQTITWSSNTSAGTITSGGLFTASCQRGAYTPGITATSGALSGSVPVNVIAGDAAAIAVTPSMATVTAGMTQQFAASVADGCGNTVSSPVTWGTTATGSSISTNGLFTAGQTNGSFDVTATLGTKTGTANVTVTGGSGMTGAVASVSVTPTPVTLAIGGMQTFTAIARDAMGTVVSGRPVTWSANTIAGTITQAGAFTAGNTAGNYADAITATIDGIAGRASIVLQAGGVATLEINPTMVTIAPGGVVTFTATARDNGGNVVAAPITWNAAIPVGTITQGGVLSATINPGNYPASVSASSNGVSVQASVTVMNGALSQLVVTPPAASVQAGGTVAFMASGRDSNGNTIAVTPTWSVASGGGTISQAGVFSAGTTSGTFANTVKAEANGLSAFSSVTVTPGPVLSVSVTPMTGTVQTGGSLQFTAEARDAFNNTVATGFTWSANAAAGTINQGGFFTAGGEPGSFPNGITAEAGGVQGFANVTVTSSGSGGGTGATGGGSGMTGGGSGMTGGGSGSTGGGTSAMGGGDGATGGGGGMDVTPPSGCGCSTFDPSFLALGLLALLRRRR